MDNLKEGAKTLPVAGRRQVYQGECLFSVRTYCRRRTWHLDLCPRKYVPNFSIQALAEGTGGADVSKWVGVEDDGIVEVGSKRPKRFVGDLADFFGQTNRPGRRSVAALSQVEYEALIESGMSGSPLPYTRIANRSEGRTVNSCAR